MANNGDSKIVDEDREHDLRHVLGGDLHAAVTSSKVLVVGAGGIGCELLKNLVLSGFTDLHVIDLDTIDVSNLNRQFLFRKRHVDMPKSVVAREAVLEFNPHAQVKAFHDNVKKQEFGKDFVSQFSLVFNALDNVSARKHVNRVCIATGTPLIESGSTGHSGQVTVISKGETECYECTPKDEGRKSYPICTIRSTPTKPVHCIEWAKELHKLLFGDRAESRLHEAVTEDSTYMAAVLSQPAASELSSSDAAAAYARRVFDAMFNAEILMKLKMRNYKGAECTPKPLSFDDLVNADDAAGAATAASSDAVAAAGEELDIYKVPSVAQSATAFVRAVVSTLATRADFLGKDVWSKDIPVHLDFLTAAANLRASVFSIPRNSQFKIKEIAGNIIPAIATTNAIVAGLQVLQAFQLLQHRLVAAAAASGSAPKLPESAQAASTARNGKKHNHILGNCRYIFVQPQPNGMGRLLNPIPLAAPNPECPICNNKTARMVVALDTTAVTLGEFVQNVLKRGLNFNEPSVFTGSTIWSVLLYACRVCFVCTCVASVVEPRSFTLVFFCRHFDLAHRYEADADEDSDDSDGPDLTIKLLSELPRGGIVHGTELSVTDDSQDASVSIRGSFDANVADAVVFFPWQCSQSHCFFLGVAGHCASLDMGRRGISRSIVCWSQTARGIPCSSGVGRCRS